LVGETLSNDTLKSKIGPRNVMYAKLDTIAILEIEFREIAVKMLLGTVLVNALHAALEDRIVALDGIGRNALSPS
jgi:hypothetical protein